MLTKIKKFFQRKIDPEVEEAIKRIPRSWTTFTKPSAPPVLFYEAVNVESTLLQMLVIRAYVEAGFLPWIFLSGANKSLVPLYEAMGVNNFCFREEFDASTYRDLNEAIPAMVRTQAELVAITHNQVRVGKYVASSMMRRTRNGRLDLEDEAIRDEVFILLRKSLGSVAISEQVIEKIQPKAVIFNDYGYTPMGELFDVSLSKQIPIYTWMAGHRYNTLIFKRLTTENQDRHPVSLSDNSWKRVLEYASNTSVKDEVINEISHSYESGEWYAEVGTQVNKQKKDREWFLNTFQLDPDKKIAVIFPHLFWDATFFWGEDLFEDYEDWFTEVVRAALENDQVNWLIKIHPSNIVKNQRDGYKGEFSEIKAIQQLTDKLPNHIKLIPADSEVSTWSLFPVMDYCLTVRGTVGIEAAIFGVRVLTAGTGRYDRRGFTTDFDDKESYLEALQELHLLERLSSEEIFAAHAYAYGLFLRRPMKTQSLRISWSKNSAASLSVNVKGDPLATGSAEDLLQLKEYLLSEEEDYLHEQSL